MNTFHIALSDSLKEFVEAQVAAGGYPSANEYIQALLKEAQKRQAWSNVEGQILDGLKSGEPLEVSKDYWDNKRRQLQQRYPEANGQ
jgi:antitoxin ParD1/3/4